MTALRFRPRHVHRTIYDYVKSELAALGWPEVAAVAGGAVANFGTAGLTFLEFTPDDNGSKIAPNTVVISLGDEPPALPWELGDGLRKLDFPVIVDIYGANQGIATSIASDVKTLFEDRYMQVLDFTTDPPTASSEYLEFDSEQVSVGRPPGVGGVGDFRRYWRQVDTQAHVYFIQD